LEYKNERQKPVRLPFASFRLILQLEKTRLPGILVGISHLSVGGAVLLPSVALNYVQCAQNINMHTAEDTLSLDIASSQAADTRLPIHLQAENGRRNATYPPG
jgi:hypothetical protein